jgi:DNA-binding transcriptional regulator YdaS (Cro superfamily)
MDKYAQALTQAMDETGTSNTRVAEVARVGRNNVAHWRVGRRPIPADHAPAIAALLGVAPERISRAYDQMLRVESAQQVMALQGLRPGSTPDAHVSLERLDGFARADMPVRIWLPEFVVRRELGPTPVQHVRWAVQLSRAMEPDIRRNALVLVDTSMCRHEDVVDGGLYAYTLWGRPDIRRILARREGWLLVGQNPAIDRVQVPLAELPDLRILGAVVGTL